MVTCPLLSATAASVCADATLVADGRTVAQRHIAEPATGAAGCPQSALGHAAIDEVAKARAAEGQLLVGDRDARTQFQRGWAVDRDRTCNRTQARAVLNVEDAV